MVQPVKDARNGLLPIEWLALGYNALTTVLIMLLWSEVNAPLHMVGDRLTIAVVTFMLWAFYHYWPSRLMFFMRVTFQMALLSYWYPDTYEFNSCFSNLDHVFAGIDQSLFGCQPALEFNRLCPWSWFSEAVNMGYFSYYPMIVVVMCYFFLMRNKLYERASFVVMLAFFIYYLIYIFVPVAGPQFYFWAVPAECAQQGVFPALGSYFSTHTDMMPAPGNPAGLFYRLVLQAQEMGERPTAAFPSSHIAITLTLLYLVAPQSKRLLYVLLPFAILLTLATVYIQAHYLIDAIAGILVSYPIYRFCQWVFSRIEIEYRIAETLTLKDD